MTRRWIRFELPVMVCVDIDDHIEHEQVTTEFPRFHGAVVTCLRSGQG